jgi:hypothetical protein
MEIQPVGVPAYGNGWVGGAVALAVFGYGVEEHFLLVLGEELLDVLLLIEPLPQVPPTIAVIWIRAVIHAHGVMKYGVEGYHFQITAVLEAGQQLCVLPNAEPVIQPV